MGSDPEQLTADKTPSLNSADQPFLRRCRQNLHRMRFSLIEFSGGLGDLGTFIPLTAAMIMVSGLDPAIVLIFAGLFNITTGIIFGLPIPVQPMKAIAAVAIAEQLLPAEIAAAGLTVGALVLFLGSTGLVEKVEQLVPTAVIRGIQLGVGLKLALKGIEMVADTRWLGTDSVVVGLVMGLLALSLRRSRRFPSALALFAIGVVLMVTLAPSDPALYSLGLPGFHAMIPDGNAWYSGLWRGALPQLPLTLLNSVLAVCALSGDLFPGRRVSTKRMAVSVGLMNVVGCGFGAMPMCHGSGGLAGQYFFGARTGGSVIMLGVGKLLVGLGLGAAALKLLPYYPGSILGVLLVFAGIQLALPVVDQKSRDGLTIALVTAAGILAVNTAIGFLMGAVVAAVMHIMDRRRPN